MFFGLNDVAFLAAVSGPPSTPLLDLYPNAAAAYSLRQLRTGVTNVVRVRRSSDNTESDFTAAQISDGTLTTFCGAGNGFVRTWYDQSGNGRHASETTQAAQPQIVSSGSVITQSAKPSIRLDGSDDKLLISGTPLNSQQFSFFTIVANSTLAGLQEIFSNWQSANTVTSVFLGTSSSTVRFTDNFPSAGAFGSANTLKELSAISSATNAITYLNGAQLAAKGSALSTRNLSTSFYIGTQGTNDGEFWNGHISEIIVYPTDQTTSRSAIQSNINAHYAIY
jgi:hypothetical protein